MIIGIDLEITFSCITIYLSSTLLGIFKFFSCLIDVSDVRYHWIHYSITTNGHSSSKCSSNKQKAKLPSTQTRSSLIISFEESRTNTCLLSMDFLDSYLKRWLLLIPKEINNCVQTFQTALIPLNKLVLSTHFSTKLCYISCHIQSEKSYCISIYCGIFLTWMSYASERARVIVNYYVIHQS